MASVHLNIPQWYIWSKNFSSLSIILRNNKTLQYNIIEIYTKTSFVKQIQGYQTFWLKSIILYYQFKKYKSNLSMLRTIFWQRKIEYLDSWINRNRIQPLSRQVQAILQWNYLRPNKTQMFIWHITPCRACELLITHLNSFSSTYC